MDIWTSGSDAMGRVIGASKIARDVSQQRRAEAALRGSEARLRFTLDAAQIGDWNLDLGTKTLQSSLQFARCFGYHQLQAGWTLNTLLQHVCPADRQQVSDSFTDAMTLRRDLRVECRVVWPDQELHWLSLHGNFEAQAEQPARMLGIVTETTQQRLAEEARLKTQQLEAENHQMLEANRLMSCAHRLTPSSVFRGFWSLAPLLRSRPITKSFWAILVSVAGTCCSLSMTCLICPRWSQKPSNFLPPPLI